LRKISSDAEEVPNPTAERNPAFAPPFHRKPALRRRHGQLLSTHPNVENRIARLNEIARQMGQL
jgi:heat shock protein HtpX